MTIHGCKDFTIPGASDHYPPDLKLEPVHLDIDLHIDIPQQSCAGCVTLTVRANVGEARALTLNAVDFEELSVRVAGSHVVDSAYDGEKIQIVWEEPFARGETRDVIVEYRVVDPRSGLFLSRSDSAEPDAQVFAVTDHETERARHWLPSIDHPSVRPTLAFHLRAAQALTILANGTLQGEDIHDDGTKTAHWTLEAPCPSYLTCFAIGEFARWEGEAFDGIPIAAFAPKPYTEAQLAITFGRTHEILEWMTNRLGQPFPYPKYYQFAAPGIGGAMENISLVSWDDRFVLDKTLATEEQKLIDIINVHEMAHSWFGDHVVCRDFAHAWLKESWATYVETCWWEHAYGDDAMAYDLWVCAQNYFRESKERYQRPIVTRTFNTSWDMYDYHLYPGGAWRIHMLRDLLGDDVFWPAVSDYLAKYGGDVVETDDFRRVLERHSGRSLGRFFDQWLHAPGYPKLKVTFTYDAEKKRGSFEIEQTQVDEKKGIPCFDFELDLAWVVAGELSVERVIVDQARATLSFPMDANPERVEIDPNSRVLHELDFDPGVGRSLKQLTDAQVRGRILAGEALAKTGKHASAIVDAFRAETCWGVRIEWAKALGEAQNEAALAALVALLADHDDPESLAALVRAAGKYRDARVVEVLQKRLETGLPYRAAEAAYEALGAQRGAAPIDVLRDASERSGWGGFTQSGALRGLGASRHQRALETLARRSEPGAGRDNVRSAALLALGDWAGVQDKRPREHAVDILTDRLRDPSRRVRAAAANALKMARVAQATSALEAYRQTLPAQEQSRLDRLLADLRRADQTALQAADKQIDELREKLRKLEDRLNKLES